MIHTLSTVLLLAVPLANAYPSSLTCDFACMAGLKPGAACGYMGIPTFAAAPTGDNCTIATDIPAGGYTQGQAYNVTFTTTTALAYKVACNVGAFAGGGDSTSKATKWIREWTASSTDTGDVTFHALCGAGATQVMYVADSVTHSPVGAACVAGSTWSAAGTVPCAVCAADGTCTAGVKTACIATADTVCEVPATKTDAAVHVETTTAAVAVSLVAAVLSFFM
jgi:hypothetical protein